MFGYYWQGQEFSLALGISKLTVRVFEIAMTRDVTIVDYIYAVAVPAKKKKKEFLRVLKAKKKEINGLKPTVILHDRS